jgi:dTMP kinase
VPTNGEHFFLVIEGLDGSGKTTITRRLARSLQALNPSVHLTFQPHDASAAGLYIRQALGKKITVPPKALALAFALNRMDHGANVIEPLLEQRPQSIVICDRYYLSSLVYQTSDALPIDQVMLLSDGVRQPDLTVFLDASTATCFRRMRLRSATTEEKRDRELFENQLDKTRAKYDTAIAFLRARGETIEKIDANSDDPGTIIEQIVQKMREHGPEWLREQLAHFEVSDDTPESAALAGEIRSEDHIDGLVGEFRALLLAQPTAEADPMREAIRARVAQMTSDDLGSLFLGYVKRLGYTIVAKMPWTDVCAYELEMTMPLELKQRGAALLLASEYSHDVITSKMLNKQLASISDFMLVLDPGESKQANATSRDLVRAAGLEATLAPAALIIGREDLADLLLADVMHEAQGSTTS